jgi:Zn-dependent protease with chaperone function
MESLTIDEFKSILAHEYAHFSHRDTFYSRFIQQVAISISTALGGMSAAGGSLNTVNPFYWFFWLYYHAYSLLSCGFSRSREFLADRMAVGLYGRSTFESGLTKVAVEGTLFEATMYPAVANLLMEGKALENIYDTYRTLDGEQITTADRDRLKQSIQEEKSAWFATHPTITERFRAIEPFPDIPPAEPQSALELFDDVPSLEKSLTDYLTGHAANSTAE